MQVEDEEIRITGGRLRIARLESELYRYLSDPAPMIHALRNLPKRPDIFTFTQSVVDTAPHYPYRMEWDNLAVIPITTYQHWWDKQIVSIARNKAKQAAKKGVVLREVPFSDELVRGIHQIYNETPIRQGRPFPHYGKAFETVYREEATFLDRSIFIGAYLADELIGFVKLVVDPSGVQAGMMNILSMIRHRDTAPNNALIAQSVRACADRGIPNLVYWRFVHGKRERDSVSDFKSRSGFQRVNLPRYYVPLTAWGSAALLLGFQNRLVDRIPEPVSEKLRELRAKWYKRRNSGAKTGAQIAL
ncbi:MAG TPA: hypothetical protein VG225_13780 [Terracidiphilus sp.]|jgi:hypothetical protein|nr:hypothetical protein [Terracidiphilus sp.]